MSSTANASRSGIFSRSDRTAKAGSGARDPGAQQPIGELIRLLSRGVAVDDPAGQPSKILDQHDPQRDRDRPKLSDRERLDILIGMHIAAQHLDIEPAVRMRDECPRDAEHARISGERAVREFWQLAVVSWREIAPNFANLLFDEMIVVDQPFRGWRDRAALVDGLDDPAICILQGIRIVWPGGLRADGRAPSAALLAEQSPGFAHAPRDARH